MKEINKFICLITAIIFSVLIQSCSTTKAIPEGEQLYTGMKSTRYENYQKSPHFTNVKEELDLILATTPNASLFGSPSMRSPFPIGLWIWNSFAQDSTAFGKWMLRAFASKPILLSATTPDLRATVGKNLLSKRGFFSGKISYETIRQRNPRKAKLRYTVNIGPLCTIDSISYTNFPPAADSLIRTDTAAAIIKKGCPFDVASLEQERQRITSLFRNHGYYYYQGDHASYLADTTLNHGRATVRLQMVDSIPTRAARVWTIRKQTINFRREIMEELHGQRIRGFLTMNYTHSRPPVRYRTLTNDLMLRPGDTYSQERHQQMLNKLNSTGVFSATSLTFTPSDSSDTCTTLDMTLDCLIEKPYDFYIETYGKGKTSGKYGPELIIGFAKRNTFRGAELFNLKAHGAYEWASARNDNENSRINDYQYGAEASLQIPRILNPFAEPPRKRHRRIEQKRREAFLKGLPMPPVPKIKQFYETPITLLRTSVDIINRAKYFKRHVVSGELTYAWRPTEQNTYQFTPLSLTYEFMHKTTKRFQELTDSMPYLKVSMADQFIPKASFQYTYQSPSGLLNPIKWQTTVSEASNLIALGALIRKKPWDEKNKKMFKNPYAQFLKLETKFTKLWTIKSHTTIAAHINIGAIWAYGNSTIAPYTEQFYVGGANSVRAFNVREIGPGRYRSTSRNRSYIEQTGDIKVLANLEYRPHLVGNLYGALFLDAGNVWTLQEDSSRPSSEFKFKNFLKEMALGTGVGLRYDLDFFIIRLDWGIGLHVPYATGITRFYNIPKFRDAQTLHLAIGLPF